MSNGVESRAQQGQDNHAYDKVHFHSFSLVDQSESALSCGRLGQIKRYLCLG